MYKLSTLVFGKGVHSRESIKWAISGVMCYRNLWNLIYCSFNNEVRRKFVLLELAQDIFILIFVLMLDQGLEVCTARPQDHHKLLPLHYLYIKSYLLVNTLLKKYRVYHTNCFLMAFLLSARASCLSCRRGCSRANLPQAYLICGGGITFRGWKQLRQLIWVPMSVKWCCSLIWTPVHWEPAQDLQSSLTETKE